MGKVDTELTSIPDATGVSHEDMVQNELDNVVEDVVAEQPGDLTPAELREALGDVAEGLDDTELMAEWAKAQKGAAESTEEDTEDEVPVFTLPNGLKIYGEDGKELTDFSKITLAELFNGKLQWGYNALGKEQKRTLDQVFRNASLGHYNEQRYATTVAERQQALTRALAAETKVKEFEEQRAVWDHALNAARAGDVAPLQALVQEYNKAMGKQFSTPSVPTPEIDQAVEQAGQQWVFDQANSLAQQYGANPLEIAQAIVQLAEQEHGFLTREKLDAIVKYELPALLEQSGYRPNGAAVKPDSKDAKIAELQKKLATITAKENNDKNQRLRTRKAPPPGSGSTPGAGESVPEFKDRQSMKEWLRS